MEGFGCASDDPWCHCLLDGVLDLLGRKYVMDIVCVIAVHGTVRFGTLEDHIPEASTSTLSARLAALAGEGLVTRQQYDEIPPRVEYELTGDGAELAERLGSVLEWVRERHG